MTDELLSYTAARQGTGLNCGMKFVAEMLRIAEGHPLRRTLKNDPGIEPEI
jgi:hypothetical protein